MKNLLRSEVRALTSFRQAVRGIMDSLASSLARSHYRDEEIRKNAIVSAKYAAAQLQDVIKTSILDARADAREAGAKLLAAELRKLSKEIDQDDELQLPPPADADIDDLAASAASASFSAKWAQLVIQQVLSWDPDSGSLAGAILDQSRAVDYRLKRLATTEVSSAFNQEHDEGAEWVADTYKDREWLPLVFKRWNATLDAKTCTFCRSHDGELTLIGTSYSGGDAPGDVHPNCRCEDTLIFIPIPVELEEAA